MKFVEDAVSKRYSSDDFNYFFDKRNGFTALWGRTKEEDPVFAPFPVILDFEITTKCNGVGNNGPCKFCYKSNTDKGEYTPFEIAKQIIDKMPRVLTQIAFGLDAKCESNPDWFDIFQYARKSGFIPNVTVADISEETAQKLASVCGAVACSRYENKNYCYDSIEKLTRNGLKQVNIHILLSKETEGWVYETINDAKTDPRLKGLNAIVFLSLKKKGRGQGFHSLDKADFKKIIDYALENEISFGFDSCSANKFLESVKDSPKFEQFKQCSEPCES